MFLLNVYFLNALKLESVVADNSVHTFIVEPNLL